MTTVTSPVTPPAPDAPDPPPTKTSATTDAARPSTPPSPSVPPSTVVAPLTPCILSTPTLMDPALRHLNPHLTPGLRDMIRAMSHFLGDPATPNLANDGRTPDLSGFYTPGLRDFCLGGQLDTTAETEMQSLFSTCVTTMDMNSLTPALTSFPAAHTGSFSLMSSPETRLPTNIHAHPLPASSTITTVPSPPSTGSACSPHPQPSVPEPPPSVCLTPFTSRPLPTSQLSESLTPLFNVGRKRKRTDRAATTQDRTVRHDRRRAAAAPIGTADGTGPTRPTRAEPIQPGRPNRGTGRALPSMIPLPVPVGVSGPGSRCEGGPPFTRGMAWVNGPHGPSLVPVELLAQRGISPYAILPGVEQQQAPGGAQLQGFGRTAITIAGANGQSARKRRRRASPDDCACTAEQARRNRAKAMIRLKQKKRLRSYEKTVRYACRKKIAMVRPRVNGRFATKEEVEQFQRTGRYVA